MFAKWQDRTGFLLQSAAAAALTEKSFSKLSVTVAIGGFL